MRITLSYLILIVGLFGVSAVFAEATCPAPGSKEIVKHGKQFSAITVGDPKIKLHSPLDSTSHQALYKIYKVDAAPMAAPKKFYGMTLSKESPYFISCSYDKGDFVLKTTDTKDFYDTDKTCKLVGVKPGNVQTTSVADICLAGAVSDCKLVCH